MKKLLLLCFTALLAVACSDDDTTPKSTIYNHSQTLTSQAEVNAFAANGYTQVDGRLHITGNDVTDLSALSTITQAGGLTIHQTSLKNLNGLQNIKQLNYSYLEISHNPLLQTIEHLSGLQQLDGQLTVSYNKLLLNLHGLENIEASEGIWIENNESLESLAALSHITKTEAVIITYNNKLATLEGMNNLTATRALSIRDNALLTDITALNSLTSLENLSIRGNTSLASLQGLESLTSLKKLTVDFNAQLPNLNGLQNLTSAESLSIWGNPSLTTLEHLGGLTSIVSEFSSNDNFYIRDNDALTSLNGLQNIINFSGKVQITDNDALANLCDLQAIMSLGTNNATPKIVNNLHNPAPDDIAGGVNCSL